MEQHLAFIHSIGERMGVPSLKEVALLPGTRAVYRVTVQHARRSVADAIVTLRRCGVGDAIVEAVYQGHFEHKPISRSLSLTVYEQFTQALQKLNFDKLIDQSNVPFYGVDMWLVERAASGYLKRVLLSPHSAMKPYLQLAEVLQSYLPEIIREV